MLKNTKKAKMNTEPNRSNASQTKADQLLQISILRLRRLNRQVLRQVEGSNNQKKTLEAIARLEEKIKN